MTQALDIFDLFESEESEEPMHITVLQSEVILGIEPKPGGVYVDATSGAGGHSLALLECEPRAQVLAFDRDQLALTTSKERLADHVSQVTFGQAVFSELSDKLTGLGVEKIDGLIADLGLSSLQLDDADRGMSFRAEGPIDMRMDPSRGETALELIGRLSQDQLADVIFTYGEERRSRRIARCIKEAWSDHKLENTRDLRRAIVRATGPQRQAGKDPATRTFQALRIAVNDELDEIRALLDFALSRIRPGGAAAIISFHSLEDRLVKRAFQDRQMWARITKKPMLPSDDERAINPRSRSAKLRVARRASDVTMVDDAESPDRVAPGLGRKGEL